MENAIIAAARRRPPAERLRQLEGAEDSFSRIALAAEAVGLHRDAQAYRQVATELRRATANARAELTAA